MPIFTHFPKLEGIVANPTARGIAIGVGVVAAVGVVGPIVFRAARPTLRHALKSAILLSEKGREVMAEAGEAVEDLVAEVRAELSSAAEAGSVAAHEVFETAEAVAEEVSGS